MVKAIGDRLAEAFAEYLHFKARKNFNFAKNEDFDNQKFIKEDYQSIRPAPGYPSCPDHSEKGTIWTLLNAKEHTGADLTENFVMCYCTTVLLFLNY